MNQIIPIDWIRGIFIDRNSFLYGIVITVVGYFLPVKNVVHIMLLFFILDVAVGYWAAKKLRAEHFNVKIIWGHTMPRITLSFIMIIASFMLDQEYHQELISIHRIVGFFISGVLLISIAKNGYKITKWSIFQNIGTLVNNQLVAKTGETVEQLNNEQ